MCSPTGSCVGTVTRCEALQSCVVRGNTEAIRQEIGAFNSLSNVHLAFLIGLSCTVSCLYVCVFVWVFIILSRLLYVLATFPHFLANYALSKSPFEKCFVILIKTSS